MLEFCKKFVGFTKISRLSTCMQRVNFLCDSRRRRDVDDDVVQFPVPYLLRKSLAAQSKKTVSTISMKTESIFDKDYYCCIMFDNVTEILSREMHTIKWNIMWNTARTWVYLPLRLFK